MFAQISVTQPTVYNWTVFEQIVYISFHFNEYFVSVSVLTVPEELAFGAAGRRKTRGRRKSATNEGKFFKNCCTFN